MSGAPCCELCKLVWNLCWAVQVGVESVNCCVFCLAQTQPSFAFSCLRFCRVSCFAIWEMQLQAVVLLLQMKLWGLFSKVFFLQVVWETPSFERKVFEIFSPLQDCGWDHAASASISADCSCTTSSSTTSAWTRKCCTSSYCSTSRWVRRCNTSSYCSTSRWVSRCDTHGWCYCSSRWVSSCNTYGWCYCSSSRWDWSWNSPCSFVCSPMPEMRGNVLFPWRLLLKQQMRSLAMLSIFFSMWGGYGSMF